MRHEVSYLRIFLENIFANDYKSESSSAFITPKELYALIDAYGELTRRVEQGIYAALDDDAESTLRKLVNLENLTYEQPGSVAPTYPIERARAIRFLRNRMNEHDICFMLGCSPDMLARYTNVQKGAYTINPLAFASCSVFFSFVPFVPGYAICKRILVLSIVCYNCLGLRQKYHVGRLSCPRGRERLSGSANTEKRLDSWILSKNV
jgi:hypothetical protein